MIPAKKLFVDFEFSLAKTLQPGSFSLTVSGFNDWPTEGHDKC